MGRLIEGQDQGEVSGRTLKRLALEAWKEVPVATVTARMPDSNCSPNQYTWLQSYCRQGVEAPVRTLFSTDRKHSRNIE